MLSTQIHIITESFFSRKLNIIWIVDKRSWDKKEAYKSELVHIPRRCN